MSFLLAASCAASDWPQFRGANHDGVSDDRLRKQWTGAVTNPVWRVLVPNALCSLAVSGGRVFTQTRRQVFGAPKEVCVALDAADGTEMWSTPVDDALYPSGGVGPDDGPRTTPAAAGDSVYVLSSYLKLFRLNVTNGTVIWQRDLRSEYGSEVIAWQNAASPVLDGDLIYLNVNSAADSLMALRISDGGLAWRSQKEPMTHSTPAVSTIFGVRQVIFATQSGLVSLEALTGQFLWKGAYPFPYFTSLGASPVVFSNLVFVTGAHSYAMRSAVFEIALNGKTWEANLLWSTNNPTAHWMTPVAHGGFLYGQFGIQQFDSPRAQLKCVDMRTGAVKWSTNEFGRGGTLLANGHLLTITERGDLVLSLPNTNAYTEVARMRAIPGFDQFTNRCWNLPALANGRVYVRSTASVACFDLSVAPLEFAPPRFEFGELQIDVRTADGSFLESNRAASVEVRTSTDLAQPLSDWPRLTNGVALTNGVLRIGGGARSDPQRFFVVREID